MRLWLQRGLRFKLSLGISLALLFILGISFLGISQYVQNQLWQRETQSAENLNAIAATLLEDAMLVGKKASIDAAIEALGESVGGHINSIAVFDDQAVLTSFATGFSGGREISRGSLALKLTDSGCWECHQLPKADRPTQITINLEGKEVIRNVVPLYNEPRCQTCHGTGQKVLGGSIVDLEIDQYQEAVNTITLGLSIGIILTIVLVAVVLLILLSQVVINPLNDLVVIADAIVAGDLDREVQFRTKDEFGQLGESFNSMTTQLRELIGSLENRVEARTQELQQRSAYLEAAADVSQRAATVLEPDVLIQQIAEIIRERFSLYYVGVFLVDENMEWAILRAGTGEAGRAMLTRNHRLKVGEGMIGWCIANAQARVALDVGEDAVRFENPDLPDTRTEAAIPLLSRTRILGALTVQSVEPIAFNQDTVTVLQTMADQIATALDNAQLFDDSQTALEAERKLYGEITREAWNELLRKEGDIGASSTSFSTGQITKHSWTPEMLTAFKNGTIVRTEDLTLAIPIVLRDQVLGVVRLRKNKGENDWSNSEIQLMDTLVDQLENTIEGARLYGDSLRRAAREQLVTEITTKIRGTTDPQEMLQTAISELRQALHTQRVQVLVQTFKQEPISDGSPKDGEIEIE